MKYIQEVSRELNVEPHVLRRWEENGWLGLDPVMKDPGNNNSRLYTDQQLERISFINNHINQQKKKGIKRTVKQEMDKLLFEEFGGEVIELESREIELTQVLPSSMELMTEEIVSLHKRVGELESVIRQQLERPVPKDYTSEFEEMKQQLSASKEREAASELREKEMLVAIEDLKKTLNEGKKGFWGSLFSRKRENE